MLDNPEKTVLQGGDRVYIPVLCLALAFFFLMVFQNVQLHEGRKTLEATRVQQQQALDQGVLVQKQLDALAIGTQRLANSGNPNARLIIEELRKAGITIKSEAPTGAPAPAK